MHILFLLNELIIAGEPITAVRAHTIGLVNQVVSMEERESAVELYASQVLQSAPEALKIYKKRLCPSVDLAHEFDKALALHREVRAGSEAEEGIKAFFEKRVPNWKKVSD